MFDFIRKARACDMVAAIRFVEDRLGIRRPESECDQLKRCAPRIPALRRGTASELLALAERRAFNVDLEAGSLFVMDYATQLHYTHGVPKTNDPVGERISLAFRVKLARGKAGGIYR